MELWVDSITVNKKWIFQGGSTQSWDLEEHKRSEVLTRKGTAACHAEETMKAEMLTTSSWRWSSWRIDWQWCWPWADGWLGSGQWSSWYAASWCWKLSRKDTRDRHNNFGKIMRIYFSLVAIIFTWRWTWWHMAWLHCRPCPQRLACSRSRGTYLRAILHRIQRPVRWGLEVSNKCIKNRLSFNGYLLRECEMWCVSKEATGEASRNESLHACGDPPGLRMACKERERCSI